MRKAKILRTGVVADNRKKVFGYCGWPSVCKYSDGSLLAVYSGNRIGHICPFGKVYLQRSEDEGRSWSSPVIAIDTPLDDRDAGITLLPDGRLMVTTFNNTPQMQKNWASDNPDEHFRKLVNGYCDLVNEEQVQQYFGSLAAISEDGGRTFSEPFHVPVSTPHGVSVFGDRILYAGTIAPDLPRNEKYPIQIAESRNGTDWKILARIPRCEALTDYGHYEPHLIGVGNRLVLSVRHDGDNFTASTAVSEDGGCTWSPLKPSGANGSPPHLLLHSDGTIWMTYGRRKPPFGIEAMASLDGGITWQEPITLIDDQPDLDLGYPCSVELSDGSVFTLYYGKPDFGKCRIEYVVWKM